MKILCLIVGGLALLGASWCYQHIDLAAVGENAALTSGIAMFGMYGSVLIAFSLFLWVILG